MDKILSALAEAFCDDCTERMQRVSARVQCGVPLDRTTLDELHQEFDTLFGGARAVHLPELEHYFRSMARYARYLRNCQMNGMRIDMQAWQDLLTGISMGRHCNGDSSDCLKHSHNERQQLLRAIEHRIETGGDK